MFRIVHKKLWIAALLVAVLFGLFSWILSIADERLAGDAPSGYIEDGVYYVMTDEGEYQKVNASTWILNMALWVLTVGTGFGAAVLFGIAFLIDLIAPGLRGFLPHGNRRLE